MAQAQLSLSWNAYQKNICNGLSLLQQRGEFVDMTLAADGHHVKVHQMVLSLVSPYIKELISSAQCPHPIIFLSNISYPILCAILEYIYTGEVLVAKDKLAELIAAGKALHIKGLREMDEETTQSIDPDLKSTVCTPGKNISEKVREHRQKKRILQSKQGQTPVPMCKIFVDDIGITNDDTPMDLQEETPVKTDINLDTSQTEETYSNNVKSQIIPEDTKKKILNPKLQYSVSNQGGLQVIYNRYIYHLRYFSRKTGVRLWRCIDYSNRNKCPANVYTNENNEVTRRTFTHNHPFHDGKILKKLKLSIIYSVFQEAENIAEAQKNQRRVPISPPDPDPQSDE